MRTDYKPATDETIQFFNKCFTMTIDTVRICCTLRCKPSAAYLEPSEIKYKTNCILNTNYGNNNYMNKLVFFNYFEI